jgi:TDG/mug DNA glycosylase family protein
MSTQQNELSTREQAASVPALMQKIMHYRPRVLCFIGLGIAKIVQAQLRLESPVSLHANLTADLIRIR